MEVSGQLDVHIFLPLGKGLPVSTGQKTGQSERYGEDENLCHFPESNADSAVVKPCCSHYRPK